VPNVHEWQVKADYIQRNSIDLDRTVKLWHKSVIPTATARRNICLFLRLLPWHW